MNWEAAIARNRQALLEIILALMASVGLQKNSQLTTLPFNLYRKALTIIRIAETAVRRLIFIAAHDLKLQGFELAKPRSAVPFSPLLLRGTSAPAGWMRGENQPIQWPTNSGATSFEPISKRTKTSPNGGALSPSHLKGGVRGGGVWCQMSGPNGQFEPLFRRYPRIFFPLIEPLKTFTQDPRDFASMYHGDSSSSRVPTPAFNLGNRLLSLHFALTNIDRQARRLLRWEARRDAALLQKIPHRMTPMRPGLPPFYSRKPVTEIEQILKECHGLTHYIRERRGAMP